MENARKSGLKLPFVGKDRLAHTCVGDCCCDTGRGSIFSCATRAAIG